MRMGEGFCERDANPQDLLVAKRPGGDQVRKRLAANQLGDQVERILDGAGLIQSNDRRVRQASRCESLAAHVLGISVRRERYPLERYLSVEQLVARSPDHAKAPCSEALE
jgi:hypothetical protein